MQSLLALLRREAELASAWRQVVTAQGAVQLEATTAYKLESLGLIKLDGLQAKLSCKLYRLYFLQHLVETKELDARLNQPEKESQFQHLGNLNISKKNQHNQLVTWHYFKTYLSTNWQRWTREMTVLSLIWCEVDYFKFYTDAYEQLAGDDCIQQIASTIHDCVRHLRPLIYLTIDDDKTMGMLLHLALKLEGYQVFEDERYHAHCSA